MAVLRFQIGVLDPDEGPLSSVNGCSRAVGQVAHRQGGFSLLRVGGWIGQVLPVGQQEHLGRFVALELAHDPAGQWPLGADGFRRVQSDQSGSGRHVGLPTAPDYGVTPAHQVAVAGFQWRGGVIGSGNAVQAEGGLAATIHHVEQNAAVAPVDVHRLEHGKVCRKLHAAGRIARRKFQVSDPLIAGVQRVHRVMGRAFQKFVCAHVAETLAGRETAAFGDFQLCNCQDASGCLRQVASQRIQFSLAGV